MDSTRTTGRNDVMLWARGWDGSSLGDTSLAGADPLGFEAGDANLYRYVGNDPVNEVDPSGLEAVGHHWIPVCVLEQFQGNLTPEALDYALGAYSGPTNPTHNYGTYGGVTHAQYNSRVRDQLGDFIRSQSGNIDQKTMRNFISNIEKGIDNSGSVDPLLGNFNDGIRAERDAYVAGGKNRGFKGPQTPESIQKRGNYYKRIRGNWFNTVVGASLASWASDALAQPVETLNLAGSSTSFRAGVKALADGDLYAAETNFFGEGPIGGASIEGFQGELLAKLGKDHAAQFAAAYLLAKKKAEAIANHD